MADEKKAPVGAEVVVPISDPEAISQRLGVIRAGLDQAKFAKKVGYSVNTVGRYERNERFPDSKYLQAVCRAYPDVSPAWLLLGDPPQLRSRDSLQDQGATYGAHMYSRELIIEVMKAMEEELVASRVNPSPARRADLLIAFLIMFKNAGIEREAMRLLLKTAS